MELVVKKFRNCIYFKARKNNSKNNGNGKSYVK